MKFVCERCHTKYSVADEKVRQKILKIRCKTCENVITIRDAVVVSDRPAARTAPPPTPPTPAARSVEWHVAVNGRQEGPLGLSALATRIQSTGRQDEVYVWNEHLDGWKEPKLVPEVAAELRARAALTQAPPAPPAQRRAPTPVPPRGRGLPPPTGTGRSSSALPAVGASARASASHQAVGTASAARLAAVPSSAAFDEDAGEKTQISAMDASMLYSDRGGGGPAKPAAHTGAAAPDSSLASLLDLSISGPLPTRETARETRPSGSRRITAGGPSGLEGLDLVPVPMTASKRASVSVPAVVPAQLPAPAAAGVAGAGVVGAPVVGGSTSMLLSQIGGRAARARHPAIKYVVTGGILVSLIIAVSVLSMSAGEKAGAGARPVIASTGEPQVGKDPEAVARAEAEKYFKSMVGDSKPDRVNAKSVGPPAPRRGNTPPRPNKHAGVATKPPPLAPPPLGSAPPATGTGVARRLGAEERRVAVAPSRVSQGQGTGSVDLAKLAAVVRQQDHTNAIKSCYERALKRDANLREGRRLEIAVTIGEMGSVRKVSIDPPTDFGGAAGCIRDSVRRWRFPATGAEYNFAFPFIFAGVSE